MNLKSELILKNLKKVDAYLREIDVGNYEFDEPFATRIGRPSTHVAKYRTDRTRWVFEADFAKKKFRLRYSEWWIENHECKWYHEDFNLTLSKERAAELENNETDYDDFFVYAEGFLERWQLIKSKINSYLSYNNYTESINNLKSFKV